MLHGTHTLSEPSYLDEGFCFSHLSVSLVSKEEYSVEQVPKSYSQTHVSLL